MPGTWRQLHYLQRPAKNIERRMIAELLLRLDRIRPLEKWRYVGLGSVYFADFALFHRTVGFTEMVNIESKDTPANRARFEFNRPFGCVDLRWGDASDVLVELDWNVPSVVWLDYDGTLDAAKLGDVASAVTRCDSPLLLMVTVNVEPGASNAKTLDEFSDRIGPSKLPVDALADDLAGWGLAELVWRVLDAEVASAIADRNGVAEAEDDRITWSQLVNFQYADGARMATVGGLVTRVGDAGVVEAADLDGLFFVRTGAAAYRLRIPNVTNREVLHLGRQMPSVLDDLDHEGIPDRELEDFAAAYRYFPSYVAVDL